MPLVRFLVYAAFVLILGSGAGWVAARLADRPDWTVLLGKLLIASLAVGGAALLVALVVGFYHLYLYFFTDRRPLGLFETTSKTEPPGPQG